MQDLSGSVLVQRFRLDALEAQDEAGDTYRGLDTQRSLAVAVTVLRGSLPNDPTVLSFQRDNLTLQTLTHKNIVPFYGLYQDESIAFLVERYVDGPNLQELLVERRGLPVSVRDAMSYLKALSQGLGYAHHFGLVHCNVKPSNIRNDSGGNILLGGFGFARTTDSTMTSTGIIGLPAYLAPEEIRREVVTPATDIYGLGMILYALLTGQHPFLGPIGSAELPGAGEQVIRAHLLEPPPDPRRLNPAIPGGFAKVILTALTKEPKDRYQNTQEMLEVACAVNDYTPEEVPERLGPPASGDAAPFPMAGPNSGSQPPDQPEDANRTQYSAPAPFAGFEQYGQPQVNVSPYVQRVGPGRAESAGAGQTFLVDGAPPAVPPAPNEYVYPPEGEPDGRRGARIRGVLPMAAIAAAGIGVLLCAFLVGLLALPAIQRGFSPAGATQTPTDIAASPTFTTLPSSTLPAATDTSVPAAAVTETSAPSVTPLPTATELPTATYTQVAPPAARTAFTVTVRNNLSYPVYVFRNDVLMGTDPIPPARFIFYRNIPAGTYRFKFCEEPEGITCPQTREVDVNRDLTIALP